jgi:hypothetical protein
LCKKRTQSPKTTSIGRSLRTISTTVRPQRFTDPGFNAPLSADLMHAEAAPLSASGPQIASLFQG